MIKKLVVKDAFSDNMLKMTQQGNPCCGGGLAICQYDVTYTQARTLTLLNITEGTTAKALPCVPATTSAADVRTAIINSLKAAGYEDDGNGPGVTVVDNGSTLTVTITGDVVAVSLTSSGGTETFNQDCTKLSLCNYTVTGSAGGSTNNLHINGVDYALGAITPGTTTASEVTTAVGGALTSAGVSGTASTTTTGSSGSTRYNITITASEQSNTFVLNGEYLTRSACAQYYV